MAILFNPFYVAIDGNGMPMAGALLYFYQTGTTTPENTYTSSALSTPNTNPVVADANGLFPPIYLPSGNDSGAINYKVVLATSANVTVDTLDPVIVPLPGTATTGGLVPTPPNDPTKFLDGQMAWVVPPSATATTVGYVPTPPNDATKFLSGKATWLKVIQTIFQETGAVATGTTVMPSDDTIPQNNEGDQYLTATITPSSAASKLVIDVLFNYGCSSADTISLALFQDATVSALAATAFWGPATDNLPGQIKLRHVMTSGTTSATTFNVRVGVNSSGTITFNGASGARLYGGVYASSITIQEVTN